MRVQIETERCKGCGYCVDFCPKGILFLSGDFNSKGYHPAAIRDEEQCTGCSLCEMVCPDFSIFLVEGDEGQDEQ